MPDLRERRSTLDLIGLLARRGPDDLVALARVARGEDVPDEVRERLLRAGLLRAGKPTSRIPARLIAPVIALEAALGFAGEETLGSLLALLRRASSRSARDQLLEALAETLQEHVEADACPPAALGELLDDLADTVARLQADDADAALITRVAALCARLVQKIADDVRLRPRARRQRPAAPVASNSTLAASVDGLLVRLPRPLLLPSASRLAHLLAPRRLPTLSDRRPTLETAAGSAASVEAALGQADPLTALYGGRELADALVMHVRLVGAGRQLLDRAGVCSRAATRPGPAPLRWSSQLEPLQQAGRVAA